MDRQYLIQMMVKSISNVFETAFFQSVDVQTTDGDILLQFPPSEKLTGAYLTFSGALSGTACIIVPDSWLGQTTADFLGTTEQTVTDTQKQDTIKEAINMIAGHMFSLIETGADIQLGIPQLISAMNLTHEYLQKTEGTVFQVVTESMNIVVVATF